MINKGSSFDIEDIRFPDQPNVCEVCTADFYKGVFFGGLLLLCELLFSFCTRTVTSGVTFAFIVWIIVQFFVPGRSYQDGHEWCYFCIYCVNYRSVFCTRTSCPGTKNWTIIHTINTKRFPTLVFSLSSDRDSFIGLALNSHFIDS